MDSPGLQVYNRQKPLHPVGPDAVGAPRPGGRRLPSAKAAVFYRGAVLGYGHLADPAMVNGVQPEPIVIGVRHVPATIG